MTHPAPTPLAATHQNHIKTHGVQLIRLTGDTTERARQHGKFLASLDAEVQKRLPLRPLAQKNQTLLSRALFPHSPTSRKFFSKLYESIIDHRAKQLSPSERALVSALFQDSGMPPELFWRSLFQPDFLMVLAAISTQKIQSRLLEGFPGCTAGAFLPAGEERAFFLRNLDYPLASYWERVPAVYYHEPTDSQKYLNISALGVHAAGLTAWNESGITFSLNAHFTKKISLRGTPIFFLGDQIIREAKCLDDAIRLCKKFKTIGSWMLLIASFTERRAVSIELSNGKTWIREMDPSIDQGTLAHANLFLCPEFQRQTLHFSGAVNEDSELRKKEMESRLSSAFLQKKDQAAELLVALGDHLDRSTGEIRIFGNTVSVVTTVQSSMISPNENSFYLSTHPETPTGLGPYLKLPFHWAELNESVLDQTPLPYPVAYSKEFKQALHEYHEAYVLWHVEHSAAAQVLKPLTTATQILPTDPHLQMQRGYFELMAGSVERALECFNHAVNEARSGKLSAHTRAVAHYFLAVCLDLLNSSSRHKAISHYQLVLSFVNLDAKLRKKTLKRLKKPFGDRERIKIEPDLQFVEPLQYP